MSQNTGVHISETTLMRAVDRCWKLLLGLRYPSTWRKLHDNGLTFEMVDEGNSLLDKARKAALPVAPLPPLEEISERDLAIQEVAKLDEPWLMKYPHIARRVSHATTEWLFADLSPQTGQAESLATIESLLTRLDALEGGKAPEGLEPKTLDALAASGLSKAERKRVAKLLKQARDVDSLPDPIPTDEPDARFLAILGDLHLWWKAASGIARTAGLKRGELIRLGLASRRASKGGGAAPAMDDPVDDGDIDPASDDV